MCWTLSKTNRKSFTTKRKDLKGGKLSDGKGISGIGRLTDKVINTLQNYVGMAKRENYNDITEMRNSIIATLYHCTNFQYDKSRHLFCSEGKNSWYKRQSGIATRKQTYKKNIQEFASCYNE